MAATLAMRSCNSRGAALLAGLAVFAAVAVSSTAAQCDASNFALQGNLETNLWPGEPDESGNSNFGIELNPILQNTHSLTTNLLGLQMVFDYDRSLANGGAGIIELFDTDCFYSYIPNFNFQNLCESMNIQVTPDAILATFVESIFICPGCVVTGDIDVPGFVNDIFMLIKFTPGEELLNTISFRELRCVSVEEILLGPNLVVEGHMETNNALAWKDTNFNGFPNPATVNELSTELPYTGDNSRKIVTGATVRQGTIQDLTLDPTKEYTVEAYIYVQSGGPVSLLMGSEEIGHTGNSFSQWVKISSESYVPSGTEIVLTIRSESGNSVYYIDDVGVFENGDAPSGSDAPPPPLPPPPTTQSTASPPPPPTATNESNGCCTGNPETDPFCCATNECCPTIFGSFLGCCGDENSPSNPTNDDCTLSDYSSLSECSQPCGPGTASRTRTFISQPSLGSTSYNCLPLSEFQPCNLGACDPSQCSAYLNFTMEAVTYPTVELTEDPNSEFHFNQLPHTQLAFHPQLKNTGDFAIDLRDIELFVYHSLYTLDFLNNWIVTAPEDFEIQCWSGSIIGPIPDFTNLCDYMEFEITELGVRITFETGVLCAGCEFYTTPNDVEGLVFLFTLHQKNFYQIDPDFGFDQEICIPEKARVPPSDLVRSPFTIANRDLFPFGQCPCDNLFSSHVYCSDVVNADVRLDGHPTLPDILDDSHELFGYPPNSQIGINFTLTNDAGVEVFLTSVYVPIGWSMAVETSESAFPFTTWIEGSPSDFIVNCLDVVIIGADGQTVEQGANLCDDSSKFAITMQPWGIQIEIQDLSLCAGCSISARPGNSGPTAQYIGTIEHMDGHTMDVRTPANDYTCIAAEELPMALPPPPPPQQFNMPIVVPGGPPSDLPLQDDLVLHLDAAKGVQTMTGGSNLVQQWLNLAQTGSQSLLLPETTVINAEANPELTTFNNKPALFFDGGDSLTVLDAAASINPGTSGYTVMIVAAPQGGSRKRSRVWLSKGNQSPTDPGYSIFAFNGDMFSRLAALSGASQVNPAAQRYLDITGLETHLHSTFFTGSNLESRMNSSTQMWIPGAPSAGVPHGDDSYSGGIDTSSEIIIGNVLPGGSDGFLGYIFEIAIFARKLEGDERKTMEQYLMNKYELTDPEPPTLSVIGGGKASQNSHPLCTPYSDPGVTIEDNLDFPEDLVDRVTVFGDYPLDVSELGIQRIRYTVEDLAGNLSPVAVRKVRVVEEGGSMNCVPDTEKPVISLIGSRKASKNRVQQGWPFVDPGATATDNRDDNEELTSRIVISGADLNNTMTPGVYKRFYNVEDEAGNKARRRRRNVEVVEDDVAPMVWVSGSPFIYMYRHLGNGNEDDGLIREDFMDLGATAYDLRLDSQEFDIDLSSNVTVSMTGKKGGAIQSIDPTKSGQYTVSYQASDRAGNTGEADRSVEVGSALPNINLNGEDCATFFFNVTLDDFADKYSWTLEFPDKTTQTKEYIAEDDNTFRTEEIEICQLGRYIFTFHSEDNAQLCCSDNAGYYFGKVNGDVVLSSPMSTWSSQIIHRFRLRN